MISWVIEELKKISFLDDIVVSTDSEKIIKIALEHNVKAPFKRPDKLSNDTIPIAPVIKHASAWYQENISDIDYVITVYPTAVLMSYEDIENAYKIISIDRNIGCIFSATEYSFPIQRAIFLDENNQVNMFEPDHYYTRSQDLLASYHDAGQFYISRIENILNETPIHSLDSRILELPRDRVMDIDTKEDFRIALDLFALKRKY
jgi:N-acylneuraminate cytidylyltransferase